MACPSPFRKRGEARDRQALVFGKLSKNPTRTWTLVELRDDLSRYRYSLEQLRSAVDALKLQGLVERWGPKVQGVARYRVVVVERQVAV